MCNTYDQCITCRKGKSKIQPHGLYTPLSVPKKPYVDICMDFILICLGKKGAGIQCCSCL
jgi:hypothetical protein